LKHDIPVAVLMLSIQRTDKRETYE